MHPLACVQRAAHSFFSRSFLSLLFIINSHFANPFVTTYLFETCETYCIRSFAIDSLERWVYDTCSPTPISFMRSIPVTALCVSPFIQSFIRNSAETSAGVAS